MLKGDVNDSQVIKELKEIIKTLNIRIEDTKISIADEQAHPKPFNNITNINNAGI